MSEVPRRFVNRAALLTAALAAGIAFVVGLAAMVLLVEPPGPAATAQLLLASLLVGVVVGLIAQRE